MRHVQAHHATSKLKVSSLASGLFRGGSGSTAASDVMAPEAISSCTGNWLSHLDWDGTRYDGVNKCVVIGLPIGQAHRTVCLLPQRLFVAPAVCSSGLPGVHPSPKSIFSTCLQELDPGRGAARDMAASGKPAAQ